MATKAPFLDQLYGAYNHRFVPKEDEELTHVGPGTPCGEYLRRFWHPIVSSAELKALPIAVRILGEELVAFRDRSGRVGLLELHCAHRGTSLEFGQIEAAGIRCCYHGWLFGVDGTILDTPGEPPDSTLKDRLCHGAYPVLEYQGLVFGYMGPPDKMPEFPVYDTYDLPGYDRYSVTKHHWPCNWLQVKDNCMDPSHTAFLHTIEMGHGFSDAHKELGTLDWMETPIGMIYIHCRRVGDNVFVRMTDYISPTLHQIATNSEEGSEEHGFYRASHTFWLLPVDDTNCTTIVLRRQREGDPPPGQSFGQDGDRPYEERQRSPRRLGCPSNSANNRGPCHGTLGHHRQGRHHAARSGPGWHTSGAGRKRPEGSFSYSGPDHNHLRQQLGMAGPARPHTRGRPGTTVADWPTGSGNLHGKPIFGDRPLNRGAWRGHRNARRQSEWHRNILREPW